MAINIAPILHSINSFDANKDTIINFSIDGMNIVPNKVNVIIKDNITNEIVYTNSSLISFGNLKHTIVKSSLTNNKYYNCFITITDINNETSPQSNTISFYCISSPIFEFVNIPDTVNISSITPILNYEQTSSIYDPLNSFIIKLTNSKGEIVYNSGIVYSKNNNLYVEINNLEEDSYKIQAEGKTLNNIEIFTEKNFIVSYKAYGNFSSIILENLFDRGQIKLQSNIIGLLGTVHGEEKYIDDKMIDLTDENTWLIFDKGFNIVNNFYIKLWMKHIKTNTKKTFLEIFINEEKIIKFFWRSSIFNINNNEEKAFIELLVTDKNLKYTIHSNYIDKPSLNDMYFIGIKKNNNLYKIHVEKGELIEKGV